MFMLHNDHLGSPGLDWSCSNKESG